MTLPDKLKNIFADLDRQNIKFCHFKSNVHLDKSVSGRTDFDFLLSIDDKEKFEEVLLAHGAKHISKDQPEGKRINNFLFFDQSSGAFWHFHIYYSLITGKKNVKQYHLPWEKYFLGQGEKHMGIPIPTPEWELLLFMVRLVAKPSLKQIMKKSLRDKIKGVDDFYGRDELKWLIDRADKEKFLELFSLPELKGLDKKDFLSFMNSKSGLTLSLYLNIKKSLSSFIRPVENNTGKSVLPKRATDKGGISIAVLGIDGSGKTTIVADVIKRLSYKLRVKSIYMGSSAKTHQRSASARLIIFLGRAFTFVAKRLVPGKKEYFKVLSRAVKEYAFARDRLSRYQEGVKLVSRGYIVIFERFSIDGVADHHTIWGWSKGYEDKGLVKSFINKIDKIYSRIEEADLFCLIDVPLDVAHARKEESQRDEVAKKYELLKKYFLANNQSDKHFVIDNSGVIDRSKQELLNIIWRQI